MMQSNSSSEPHPNPDVLIIGAGPTGAVAAKRLAEAGFKVVCLEQGDWPDYTKARAGSPDYELRAGLDWNWAPKYRQAPSDYPIEESESDITPLMWNGVGGSSVMFAAQWHRNLPSDFCVRSLDGVADDWPLTYTELEPFYSRVERDFGISGLPGDTAYPTGTAELLPPAPLGRIGRRIIQAHNQLGWHWWPGSNAIATRAHGRLNPCTQRATCLWGCAEGAKGSADRSHWPVNLDLGVKLITGARVQKIEMDNQGRATGALYIDRSGQQHFQAAPVTILAANGIGTPRLLLASATNAYSSGLANSSGLLGKRLMMHPFATVVGLFDEDLGSWQGVWGQLLYTLQFYETDASRGFVRGAKWGLQPTGGPLSATRSFPWGEGSFWGEHFHQELSKRFGHSAMWGIIAEDLPDEANWIRLDPELKDSDGIPAAKIHYQTSENSRRLLAFHIERAKESLQAAGAYETIVAPQLRESGWHLLGTATMGNDPKTSVVNKWGRTHDIPNLYIFDGSVWPTSSGMNPTATIAALSLYFTDHLIAERHNQEVPA